MAVGCEREQSGDGGKDLVERSAAEAAAHEREIDAAQDRAGQRDGLSGALADLHEPGAAGCGGAETFGERAEQSSVGRPQR